MNPVTVIVFLSATSCAINAESLKTTKVGCNHLLENKIVSFESNFYPGNQLEPGTMPNKGYIMQLHDTWKKVLNYTNGSAWKSEKCWDSLCISSLKTGWESYFAYVDNNDGLNEKKHLKLSYYPKDPPWTGQFDIKCEACSTMKHCYVINKLGGSLDENDQGRMLADINGRSVIRYQVPSDYDAWFDWTIHLHDHVPARASRQFGFIIGLIISVIALFTFSFL